MPTDARIFSGRMNDDDHGTIVPGSDYRYARNIHIMHSNDGGVAAIKNVPGTTEVPFTVLGTTGTQVVGSIEDEQYNRVFYFVKSTTGPDYICCYLRNTNEVKMVLRDNILASIDGQGATLGLSENNLITGVAYIYPWLFWTDNNGAPRRIDTERGIKTNDPLYFAQDGTVPVAYSAPINLKDVSIIREPPRYPIETRKLISTEEASVPNQVTNQIALFAFQFSYRFLYVDGSVSVIAPYSKTVYPNTEDDEFDTIEITIPKRQRIPRDVDAVEILVRTPGQSNWSIIKKYDRRNDDALLSIYGEYAAASNAAPISFFYFNNYYGSFLPEAEAIKPFDSVPLKSKAMEVASNRLFLANNTEGYDPIPSLLLSGDIVTGSTIASTQYILAIVDTDGCSPVLYVLLVAVDVGDPAIDGVYFVNYQTDTFNWYSAALPTSLTLSPDQKIGGLNTFAPAYQGLIDYYANLFGCTANQAFSSVLLDYPGDQPTVFGLGQVSPILDGDLAFKSGSRYQIGIVFYDYAGRNAGVYTNDDCLVSIPDRKFTTTDYATGISWLIDGVVNNNNIPFWATHYSIVITKNLTTTFFAQQYGKPSKYVTRDEDGLLVYSDTYPVNEEVYAIAWDAEHFFLEGLGYVYTEGDVLKYMEFKEGFPDPDPVYYPIIGQEGRWIFTPPEDLGILDVFSEKRGLLEIYTPALSSTQEIFYEVGELFNILNPGTIDKSFSAYSGAIRGDVFHFNRTVNQYSTPSFLTENMSPNNNSWTVWNTDTGRPNIVLYDAKQERRSTAIRWSNQYVAGAKINGLCSFDEVDEVVLDESCGPIQKLVLVGKAQSEGSVMLSIGTNNTFSMYLGETQIVDNSEQTLLATSGKIIGTVRDLRGGYGTNHPESVVENDGRAYWYDEQRGTLIRYAANGLTPISDYKFRAFFNRLSNYTRGYPVIGGFDRLRSEYLFTVKNLNFDTDVEFLEDYDGVRIATGNLAEGGQTSLPITLYAGATYTLEATWSGSGNFFLYVGGNLVATQAYTGFDTTETITISPASDGILSYVFVPKAGEGGRGTYILSGPLISPHQAWRGEDFTLGFRDIDNSEGFTCFYSFTPEWFSKSGNLLLSFRNGKLYRHDNENAYNTFYGTQYTSGIAWVTNNPVPVVKWPAAIGVQSNYMPSWVHVRTENPYIQSSDLEEGDFVQREGFYYADILRDRLSPNTTGSFYEKSLKGDKMRSTLLEVYVEFSIFADELYVYLIKTMWQPSSGHF